MSFKLVRAAGIGCLAAATLGAQPAAAVSFDDLVLFDNTFPDIDSSILADSGPFGGGSNWFAGDVFSYVLDGARTGTTRGRLDITSTNNLEFLGDSPDGDPTTQTPPGSGAAAETIRTGTDGDSTISTTGVGELRASAFISENGTLAPTGGLLHDGSNGLGILTITGEFDYDIDGVGPEPLIGYEGNNVGNADDPLAPLPLLRAFIADVRVVQDGAGDDIQILWTIDTATPLASLYSSGLIVTKINSQQFNTTNNAFSFDNQAGLGFNLADLGEVDIDNRYAEVPVPAALPLLAGALGGLALIRRRRGA